MIVSGQSVVEWVAARTNEYGNFGAAVGIGWQVDGAIRGGVVFNEYNGPNINIHAASDGRGYWMQRPMLRAIFDYPFNQAKVNRMTALVGSGNAKSRKLVEHLGFELEATLSGAHPTGDLLVYVMWKERCEWISQGSEKRYALAA